MARDDVGELIAKFRPFRVRPCLKMKATKFVMQDAVASAIRTGRVEVCRGLAADQLDFVLQDQAQLFVGDRKQR